VVYSYIQKMQKTIKYSLIERCHIYLSAFSTCDASRFLFSNNLSEKVGVLEMYSAENAYTSHDNQQYDNQDSVDKKLSHSYDRQRELNGLQADRIQQIEQLSS
jgi:hypothetical protein